MTTEPSQRRAAEGSALGGVVIAAGLAIAGLLAALTLLYVNLPAGYDAPYGLSLDSTTLFRGLWSYPVLSIPPGLFTPLAALAILLLWLTYGVGCGVVWRCSVAAARKQVALIVVAFACLYHPGLTLLMPPVLSTDIYHYALFGRMVAVYDLNPYVTSGAALAADPLWQLVGWRHREVTSHYGPAWTLISAGVAALSNHDALLTTLAFKGIAAAFNLANCALVFLLARRLGGGDGVGALVLYSWNPLILVETAGSGHNDAAMMTFALLGLLLAARGRLLLGLAALVLSVLIKYLTALLVLFFVIHCLSRQESWRRAIALGVRMALVAGLLAAGLFAPFWLGPQTLERLTNVGSPFNTPLRVALRELVLARWASEGGVEQAGAAVEPAVILALHVGFAGLVLQLMKMAYARGFGWPRVLELWGVASLVYMTLVYGWNLPWFLISALATTCLVLNTRASVRLLALTHALAMAWTLPYAVLVPV